MPLEKLRIAVPVDDREEAEKWLAWFHLPPMTVVEKRSTIYVLRPAAVVLREKQQKSASALDEDRGLPRITWARQSQQIQYPGER